MKSNASNKKRSKKITQKKTDDFYRAISPILQTSGNLREISEKMEEYGIDFDTEYTKGQTVLKYILERAQDIVRADKKTLRKKRINNLVNFVSFFLDNGCDGNRQDEYGMNLLFGAWHSKLAEIYELLLKRGVEPNYKDVFGFSALSNFWYRICRTPVFYNDDYKDALRILELLLSYGANPWVRMQDWYDKNRLPAFEIMSRANEDCVLIRRAANPILYDLFTKGAEIDEKGVGSPYPEEETRSNVSNEISEGTALKAVYSIRPLVRAGNVDGALDLLREKFNVDYCTVVQNYGQYFFALLFGEMSELTTPDQKPIHDAYMALITRFLDGGVDVNMQRVFQGGVGVKGDTLLTLAVYNREPELCKRLIKRGADPNIVPQLGYSSLRAAVKVFSFDKRLKIRSKECVSALLKAKASLDAKYNNYASIAAVLEDRFNAEDKEFIGLKPIFQKYGYFKEA
ncbi:MAG: hypothetical protein IJU03_02880 [Thermoguttaceae bacterium]|nr:hypothetical protein [Thermoguttaceae bacterium]